MYSKLKTRKAIDFKSLRLNCSDIFQLIKNAKCQLLLIIINILSYSVLFIKKINLLRLRHRCFPGEFMNFQKQPLEVFYEKSCS